MIYPFLSLKLMMLIAGFVVLASHGFALVQARSVQEWLKAFPRSREAGIALFSVAAVWFFILVSTMDLGEFSVYRRLVQVITVFAFYLALRYRDEFLAVRALGMLLLLVAEVLIEPAFLKPQAARLLLVLLAYVWVTAGLFWVGMPYLLRDQIAWISAKAERWKVACGLGVVYGAALLIAGLLFV